jgi:hypothetical protein
MHAGRAQRRRRYDMCSRSIRGSSNDRWSEIWESPNYETSIPLTFCKRSNFIWPFAKGQIKRSIHLTFCERSNQKVKLFDLLQKVKSKGQIIWPFGPSVARCLTFWSKYRGTDGPKGQTSRQKVKHRATVGPKGQMNWPFDLTFCETFAFRHHHVIVTPRRPPTMRQIRIAYRYPCHTRRPWMIVTCSPRGKSSLAFDSDRELLLSKSFSKEEVIVGTYRAMVS